MPPNNRNFGQTRLRVKTIYYGNCNFVGGLHFGDPVIADNSNHYPPLIYEWAVDTSHFGADEEQQKQEDGTDLGADGGRQRDEELLSNLEPFQRQQPRNPVVLPTTTHYPIAPHTDTCVTFIGEPLIIPGDAVDKRYHWTQRNAEPEDDDEEERERGQSPEIELLYRCKQ